MILIEIEDLHIIVNDNKVCLRNNPFEFGIIVKKIVFRPTDDHFKDAFVEKE